MYEENHKKMSRLLEKKNISLSEGTRKSDRGNKTKDHDRFHALKASFSQSQDFLIDYGSSNHMVSSKEPLSSLDLSDGSSIHMGDDSQIPIVGKGSIQFEHGVLKNVLYVPSLAANLLSIYQM